MGQDEDAQPLVRRANFCRAEQTRRRRVAHAPKLSQNGFKAEGDVPRDVFEKDPFWTAFRNNAGDHWPEVARVVGTTAPSGRTEGLAGISGEDDVEGTTEGTGIKIAEIVPDRGRGDVPSALGANEDASGICLPFDKCEGVKSGFSEHDAQIQASAACAEG